MFVVLFSSLLRREDLCFRCNVCLSVEICGFIVSKMSLLGVTIDIGRLHPISLGANVLMVVFTCMSGP